MSQVIKGGTELMNKVLRLSRNTIAVAGGLLTAYLGGWDMMLRVLGVFVVLDYITGVVAAWFERNLDSEIGARGIVKKILLFVIVGLAYQLDKAIGHEVCRSLAIWFYLANEALSVLENCGRAGVPIPSFLRTTLEQLKSKSGSGEKAGAPMQGE